MPSPKKRKIRKAIGNIHPAGVLTDAQKTDTFVEVLLSENAHNHAASPGGKSFENGEIVSLGAEKSADGLLTAGEQDSTTAMTAFAQIVFGGNQTADKVIDLTGSAGLAKLYTAKGTQNAAANQFKSDAGAATNAENLKLCIENSAGHNGAIKVLRDGATLTLYQNVEGSAGNTFIHSDLDNCNAAATFTGGTDSIEVTGAIRHYWFDTTNAKDSLAAAAAAGVAITASSGIIYDPSGPNSKYISGCETVSSGTAMFMVFRPETWDSSGDLCNIEIVGNTNTADKLSLVTINASAAASTPANAIDSGGTMAAFTNKTGDMDHNSNHQRSTDSAGGFAIKWERDSTGLAESDIKKGWYVRWNTTND